MEQKNRWIAAFVTALLGIGIITGVVLSGDRTGKGGQDYGNLEGAAALFMEIIVMLVVGLLLLIDRRTKPIGQGVLIGMSITLVVGFAICSSH